MAPPTPVKKYMKPNKQPVTNSLLDQIDALFSNGQRLSSSDIRVPRARAEIKKLTQSSDMRLRADGYMLETGLNLLIGNDVLAKELAHKALTASFHSKTIAIQLAQFFCKAAMFEDALDITNEYLHTADPEYLSWQAQLSHVLLLTNTAQKVVEMNRKLGSPDMPKEFAELLGKITRTIEDWNLNPEQMQQMVALAFSIAKQDNKLLNTTPALQLDKNQDLLWYHIPVQASPAATRKLNNQFIDSLFETMPDAPIENFHVSFVTEDKHGPQ
ncbi:hypothetical protein [Deefgea piscis]|uniref:hypothetical protein n=1 Tax=Deefgea piscis TaxID=2739061 RepID=UPI001C8006D1|nr:hypothetical protein [Deefgea piscis]QZA80207.1 hypothetical protein K4H25_11755 [Deefgea piscis]